MNVKAMLWLATAALLGAGACALAFAALWPMPAAVETPTDDVAAGTRAADAAGTPHLPAFAKAWSRDLRRPLTDDPAARAAASPTTAASSDVPVRLVGTIIDPQRPRGIFITTLGQMELRAVGERAGGTAEILRVDERSATISIAGRIVTLKVEKLETVLSQPIPSGQPLSVRTSAGAP